VNFTGSNSCVTNNTAHFLVHPPAEIIIDTSYYEVGCFDTLVIGYNNTSFVAETWTLNANPTTNYFDAANLQIGMNTAVLHVVDSNGCSDSVTVQIEFCGNLSFDELKQTNIELWPNPNDGTFSIKLLVSFQSVKLTITDVKGKPVFIQSYNDSSEIQVSKHFPAGFYLIELELDGIILQSQIIVQ